MPGELALDYLYISSNFKTANRSVSLGRARVYGVTVSARAHTVTQVVKKLKTPQCAQRERVCVGTQIARDTGGKVDAVNLPPRVCRASASPQVKP